jgi:hypothetical protein
VEYEPRFVDIAVRRWQASTGRDAIHLGSGRCFDVMAALQVEPAPLAAKAA